MIRKLALVALALAAVSLWDIGWLSVYRTIFVTAPAKTPPIRFIAFDVSPDTIPEPHPRTIFEVRNGWLQFARSSAVRSPSPNKFHGLPMVYQYYSGCSAELAAVQAEVARARSEAPPGQMHTVPLDPSTTRVVRYTLWRHFWLSPFALALLLGAHPLVAAIRRYVRRVGLRRSVGICLTFSYNLTGNVPGACPECGTEVVRS